MSSSPQHSLTYRPDIDGLRAVAVLSVVLYHIDEALVPGGFTGVDIFFVISGYLITAILKRDIATGRFSIADFYRRRLLRIGPAYFAVTVATLVAGSFVMLPDDMRSLAMSAAWSAVALPNVHFWLNLDTGYFAAASNQVPLLHLWSLGVEEQFYAIWPLTLLVLGRWLGWRNALLGCVGLIAAGSFIVGQYTAVSDPGFAYYMLPARAGELLIGGLLAIRGNSPNPSQRSLASELAMLSGFALIAWGLFGLDGDSRFPGFNALFPTVGAALIIQAGAARPRFGAFLQLRPMVFIGLISYSLYLWHWPILALLRYTTTTLDTDTKLAALVAMLAAAYASYRWVELPFRQGKPSKVFGRHALASYAGFVLVIGLSALSVVKVADHREADIVIRHAEALEALNKRMRAAFAYDYNCQRATYDPADLTNRRCIVGEERAAKAKHLPTLLIGDSNAAHYIGVIGAIAKSEGFAFRNVSLSSCPPLFGGGNKYGKPKDKQGCTLYRNEMRKFVSGYRYVLLGAQWSSHSRVKSFKKDLERTLGELTSKGITVIILGQVPRFPSFNQNCELARVADPGMQCVVGNKAGVIPPINDYLQEVASRHSNVSYIDISDVVCPEGKCSPYLSGAPIYYDPGHLSMAGSWDVGQELVGRGAPLKETFRAIANAGSGKPSATQYQTSDNASAPP